MSTDLRVSDGLDTLTPDDVNRLLAIVLCDECTIERRNEGIKELKRRIYTMRDRCSKAERDLESYMRSFVTRGRLRVSCNDGHEAYEEDMK